ncbi:manganese efflux pump MntP family protein [Peptococcaceae bacterium]|nr:manganese efflux pump MntP family protein [Peptococcaceae bacterium]
MDLLTISVIAVGLAMDAFAVSVVSGFSIKNLKTANAFKIAMFFGMFQFFMPLVGWKLSINFTDFTHTVSHWVAFLILSFIGCKMLYKALKEEEHRAERNPLDTKVLFVLSIATSIDALAVGVSFAVLEVAVLVPAIIIGLITFCICFAAVFLGNKFGARVPSDKIEIAGGIMFIMIGLKILLKHM